MSNFIDHYFNIIYKTRSCRLWHVLVENNDDVPIALLNGTYKLFRTKSNFIELENQIYSSTLMNSNYKIGPTHLASCWFHFYSVGACNWIVIFLYILEVLTRCNQMYIKHLCHIQALQHVGMAMGWDWYGSGWTQTYSHTYSTLPMTTSWFVMPNSPCDGYRSSRVWLRLSLYIFLHIRGLKPATSEISHFEMSTNNCATQDLYVIT